MPENDPTENHPLQEANQRRVGLIEKRNNSYAHTAHAVIDATLSVPPVERPQVTKAVKASIQKARRDRDIGDTYKATQDFMEEAVLRTLARFPQEGKKTRVELIPILQSVNRDIYDNAPAITADMMGRDEQERKIWKEGEVWQKYFEYIGKIAALLTQVNLQDKDSAGLILQVIHWLNKGPNLDWRKEAQRASMEDEDVFLELLNLLEGKIGSQQTQTKVITEDLQPLQQKVSNFITEIRQIKTDIEAAIRDMDRARNPF